jgi:hypothetical protein
LVFYVESDLFLKKCYVDKGVELAVSISHFSFLTSLRDWGDNVLSYTMTFFGLSCS